MAHGVLQLLSINRQYQANKIWVETACNPPDEDGFIEKLKDEARIQNLTLNLEWAHPTESKLHRAFGVQGLVQSGRVYFDYDDPDQLQLMNDLRVFIGDDKMPDDRVDGLVHGLTDIKDWGGRLQKSPDFGIGVYGG